MTAVIAWGEQTTAATAIAYLARQCAPRFEAGGLVQGGLGMAVSRAREHGALLEGMLNLVEVRGGRRRL